MNRDLMTDAVECFGGQVVAEVIEMVSFADADAVFTTYQDMGMTEHAECLEMLFF